MTKLLQLLRENWLPMVGGLSLVLLAALGIVRADLTDGMSVLLWIVPISFLMGSLLALSVFSRRTAILFSLVYAGFFIFIIVGATHVSEINTWNERIVHLINLQADWVSKLFNGGTSREPIIFIMHTSAVFWIMGHSAAWWTLRSEKIWRVVIPSGIVLLSVVYYYFGPRPLWLWLAMYVIASFLFIAFNWLNQQQKQWRQNHVYFERRVGLNVAGAGLALALATLTIAWQVPTLEANSTVTTALDSTTPAWQQFQNTWTRLFSSLRTHSAPTNDTFADSLTLGGARNVGESLVMDVFVEEKLPYAYWHAISYETYQDGLWQSPDGNQVEHIPDDGFLDMPSFDSRKVITQTVRNYLPSAGQIYGMPDIIGSDRQMFLTSRPLPGQPDQINMVRSKYVLQQGEVYNSASQFSTASEFELRNARENYPEWTENYVALPDSVTQRTRDLAEEITAQHDNPYDQAIAIQNYLRENITYNDQIPTPPDNIDPVDYVLFEFSEGYCNYYSSAMVVMLRHLGIPSRPASGFAAGEFIEDANLYRVRLQDAHTWVEAYFPEYGWIQFEPTSSIAVPIRPEGGLAGSNIPEPPPIPLDQGEGPNFGEDELFPGGDSSGAFPELEPTTFNISQYLSLPVFLSVLLILVVGLTYIYTSINNFRAESDLNQSYARLGVWGDRLGASISPAQTPTERAKVMIDVLPSGQKPIDTVTEQFIVSRYSQQQQTDPNFDLKSEWKELRPMLNKKWVNQRIQAVRRWRNRLF